MTRLRTNCQHFDERSAERLIRNGQHAELFDQLRLAPNNIFPCSGNGILHLSARYSSISFTKSLIQLGCNVNIQNRLGNTALMDAVLAQKTSQVKLLLEAKSDIHLTNFNGDTALKSAVKSVDNLKKLNIMRHFLESVKNNASNSEEIVKILKEANCSLTCAVFMNDVDVIKLMLDQEDDINDNNFYDGWTALHAAVSTHNYKMVRLLVQHGCDASIADEYGYLPLIHMVGTGIQCSTTITALMPANIDWTETCRYSGWMKLRFIFLSGIKETLQLFLQFYNVNLTLRDKKGMTPLHYLVCNNNDGIFDIFENFEFDIDACDKDFKKTALHVAAIQGNVNAVRFLLAKGAVVNAADCYGFTPLFYTLARETRRNNEYRHCIELLVQQSANVQVVTPEGETVFEKALRCQNYFLTEPIVAHLVIVEAAGKPIERLIREQINCDVSLRRQYELCKQEITKMKIQTVYGTVTLLKFLIDDESKVALYTRKQELFDEAMSAYFPDSDSYYFTLLRKRFDRALKIDALRTKAASILYETIGMIQCNYIIVTRIIDFLSYKDLLKYD